eukprot:COSAG01_NODE_1251_length_11057_cov_48.905092_2_plen_67_part_00
MEANENDTCVDIAKRCKLDETGNVIVDTMWHSPDHVDVNVIVCVLRDIHNVALTRLTGSAMSLVRC